MVDKKIMVEERDIILSSDSYRDRMKGYILIKDEDTNQKYFIWDERVKDYYLNNCKSGMRLRIKCIEDEGYWHVLKITILDKSSSKYRKYEDSEKKEKLKLIDDVSGMITDNENQSKIIQSFPSITTSLSTDVNAQIVIELKAINEKLNEMTLILGDLLKLLIDHYKMS